MSIKEPGDESQCSILLLVMAFPKYTLNIIWKTKGNSMSLTFILLVLSKQKVFN